MLAWGIIRQKSHPCYMTTMQNQTAVRSSMNPSLERTYKCKLLPGHILIQETVRQTWIGCPTNDRKVEGVCRNLLHVFNRFVMHGRLRDTFFDQLQPTGLSLDRELSWYHRCARATNVGYHTSFPTPEVWHIPVVSPAPKVFFDRCITGHNYSTTVVGNTCGYLGT